MSRFWAGFGVASLLWAAVGGYFVAVAGYGPREEEVAVIAATPIDEVEPEREASVYPPRRRRRSRGSSAGSSTGQATPRGDATSGDDLREDEMRTVDLGASGGEQQLRASQIEAGFDSAMPRIRRCLVLMAGSDPVTGRVTFGLRVAGTGAVRAVQLGGPAAATTGEAGDCLRAAARAIRFPSFDGPEIVVRYPLELE